MVSSKKLRNQLILLWWYELFSACAQMYKTINAYLDDCKPSIRILAMYKIQFVIFTFQISCSHYRFFVTIQHVHAQIIRALFVAAVTHEKLYTVELVSLRRRALHDCVNFMNFAFWIKYHFNVFNFIEFYFIMWSLCF